ncbi:MAG: N-carbamoyl-D-amino-acid hydrolase [Acidobacteria bacterium]|nr:N-carbamoyl-D-amino-acid hydrolase [Acidobacteriota bacterium]
MSRHLKVAAAQLGPIHRADTREAVVKRLVTLFREAASSGCRLVVFPELALTTFFPRYYIEDPKEIDSYFERSMPNPAVQPLFDEARKAGVGFHLGYAELTHEDGKERRFNTAILVAPDGRVIAKYRKIHLPGHSGYRPQSPFQHLEKRYFEVGNGGFKVYRAFGGIIGLCICNDRRWPETFRVMGLQGVEMVVLGFNTPDTNIYHPEPVHRRMFHHMLSLQAGAYQNATWVVASAKAGKEDGFGLIGGSAIVAPTGEIAAQSISEDDELIMFDCDLDIGRNVKENIFNFAKHRRIEHYKLITEQTGVVYPPEE